MALSNLIEQCGTKAPPGVEVDMYVTCSCELNGFPALTGTGEDGDVRLSEAFDFTGADPGEGYFRQYTAVVDKNGFSMGFEGEVGSEALFANAAFYIKGTDSTRAQFANDIIQGSGCLVILMKPRTSDDYVVIGSVAVPAFIESLDFNSGQKTGDSNGAAYSIRANSTVYYYAASLGVNTTPAT